MLLSILIIIISISYGHARLNETIIRQNRRLPSTFFDEIIVDGAFDINIGQLNGNSAPIVEIEASVSSQKYIAVEILDKHILSIRVNGPLVIHKNIKGYIKFKSPLKRYTIKGTGSVITDDNGISNLGDEKFVLDNRGTANVAIQLNVNELEVYLSGTGNSRFWGQVRQQATFETKGVGDVNAMNLLTKQVKVYSTGVSTVRVAATDDIEVEVNGVSTIYYRLPAGKEPSKETSVGLGQIIRLS